MLQHLHDKYQESHIQKNYNFMLQYFNVLVHKVKFYRTKTSYDSKYQNLS